MSKQHSEQENRDRAGDGDGRTLWERFWCINQKEDDRPRDLIPFYPFGFILVVLVSSLLGVFSCPLCI